MNDTPTPSPFATDGQRTTDAECWMNYCLEAEKGLATVTEQRDEWKEKYIQQNKDLGHELRDPNGTIWSDSPIHEQIRTMNDTPETDAFFWRKDIDWDKEVEFCRKLERELTAVTEQRDAVTLRLGKTQERMIDAERQRDRLAEALEQLITYQPRSTVIAMNEHHVWRDAKEALQSLPPKP